MIIEESVPQELTTLTHWVLWQEETRDGKPTKVPYNPTNPSQKAKSNGPETWGTFEQALNASKTNGFGAFAYNHKRAEVGLTYIMEDKKTGVIRSFWTEVDPRDFPIIENRLTYVLRHEAATFPGGVGRPSGFPSILIKEMNSYHA